uniref:Putative ovule protein n=1 Tax=Solanum chacoense TaxID=4108 RepID=A0A0V0H716_SOLCH
MSFDVNIKLPYQKKIQGWLLILTLTGQETLLITPPLLVTWFILAALLFLGPPRSSAQFHILLQRLNIVL